MIGRQPSGAATVGSTTPPVSPMRSMPTEIET
jgi:hypothetical protein